MKSSGAAGNTEADHDQPKLLVAAAFRLRAKSGKKLRGGIYARFSSRFQNSIEDQVRACLAWAAANGVEVDEDRHVFEDRKKSGRTHKRPGFQQLLVALHRDEIDVVITFATNRIYRKMYQSLRFAEEEIVSCRKRIVFVAQGIDTAKTEFWRQLLTMYSMLDEVQVSSMATFIRNAHVGLLDKEQIHGTITFGYRGDVIPGELTRRNKPKTKWAIDDDAAAWVRRVFEWFNGKFTIAAIARRLNREGAPLSPRCQSGRWTAIAVTALLRNPRYVGDFSYGRKEAVWQAKQGYARQFTRDKPLAEKHIERLRIIDNATFAIAQARLDEQAGRGGRPPASAGGGESPPHLLRELLWCPRHQRYLGTFGWAWACIACKRELRQLGEEGISPPSDSLYSQVDARLACRLLCEKIAGLLQDDEDFASMVREKFAAVVPQLQAPDATTVDSLQREHALWTTKINGIYEAPAETQADKDEQHQRLAQFQRGRADVQRQLDAIDDVAGRQLVTPTEAEVRAECRKLRKILLEAASSTEADLLAEARAIVHDVTGGRVVMTQQGESKAKRGWLRASFMPHWVGPFASGPLPQDVHQHERGDKVDVDLREATTAEVLAEKVMAGVNEGKLLVDVATELKIRRNVATAAYQQWHRDRGLVPPDGRSRRATLTKKHRDAPPYQAFADEVMKRFDTGMLLGEIASELRLDRNTVTSSVAWWHAQRSLPVPDGRARRRTLAVKTGKRRQCER